MRIPLALLILAVVAAPAGADDLFNNAFRIQYDESGVRSLRRTNDVHDTDYIAANGRLGRLLVRYRTAVNGDWRELRELFQNEMTAEESAAFHTALRIGDTAQAEAILAEVAIRYLQRKPKQ